MHPPDGPRFGPYSLDRRRLVLWRGDELVGLQPLPTRVLLYLADRAGQVVTREELHEAIWGRDYIGIDDRLNTCIAAIRSAVGDSASEPRYIETLRGRGYRFVARTGGPGNAVADRVRSATATTGRGFTARRVAALGGWALVGALTVALAVQGVRPTPPEPARGPGVPGDAIDVDPAAWELYVRASMLGRSGRRADLMRAGDLLEEAVALAPGFARAQAARTAVNAILYLKEGDGARRERAMEALTVVNELAPGAPETMWGRGMAALYAERAFAKAAALLDTASLAWPDVPDVLNARAEAARRLGDWTSSNDFFSRALEQDPLNAVAAAGLAANHDRLGDFELADRYYALATALSPFRADLVLQRARLQLRHGADPAQALVILEEHAPETGLEPAYAVHLDSELARVLGPLTRWWEADSLDVGVQDRAFFDLNRAWMARGAGRDVEALELLGRAAVRFGRDAELGDDPARGIHREPAWLALTLALSGDEEEARRLAQSVLDRRPGDRDAVFGPYVRTVLAETFATLGDTDRTVMILEGLLTTPSGLTRRQLFVDPVWEPVRNDPRFRRLAKLHP